MVRDSLDHWIAKHILLPQIGRQPDQARNHHALALCVLPSANGATRQRVDLEVNRRAIAQLPSVRLVFGHQVPARAAAARGPRRAGNPAPAVAVEVDEAAALVGAETSGGAARGNVGRVGLGVGLSLLHV